ncbi:Protein tramtrack, alpha isoform [Armadillidium vulgare]|nr:Protein tramtrack, alpha isoform [Armadillidium vulgare]
MAEYCLRWNNHQPNLVTVFSELLNAETLVDVTLATDGHFIHAHKLVLSACSVYFKDLFGSNPCKHPIVFLKDIKIEDLKTVIDFIYRGEVNVSQERLQDVLKTAESLRIKGLADKPFSYDEYPSQSRSGGQQHLSSSFSSQRSSLTDSREQQQSGDADDLIDVSGGDAHSPPAHKKRKVAASQDSSDGAQGSHAQCIYLYKISYIVIEIESLGKFVDYFLETNHEEDRHKSNGKEENAQPQKPPSATPTVNDEGTTTTTPKNSSGSSAKEKQKDEKEVTAVPVASESRPEFQEYSMYENH